MGDFKVEGGEIKKAVKAAKKGPVAFGFNAGKSDEDAYLAMDRKKAPAVVGKDAKEGGEGGKFAFGTATVAQKTITLTCQRELPGLAKRLKRYLKSQKVMLNVVVLDAQGNPLESDIEEDLPDDPDMEEDDGSEEEAAPDVAEAGADADTLNASPQTASPQPEAKADGERIKQLTAELGILRKEIEATSGPMAETLMKAFVQLVGFLRAGEVDKVSVGIGKVRGVLSKIPQAPAPDSEGARAQQVANTLDKQITGVADPTMRGRLQQAMEQIRKTIGEDAGNALAAMKKLSEMVAKANAAGGASKPRLSGAPLRGFLDARDAAVEQISKLQGALRGTGHPALVALADKGFAGITGRLQVGLQAALMDVDGVGPAERPKAVAKAVAAVEAFKATLASDPVIGVLEENPFGVAVTLRGDIGAALDTIRQALDA